MKTKLEGIVEIRLGFQFRGKVVPAPQEGIDVIQIKDINGRLEVDVHDLTAVQVEKPERYLVEPGDVLFLSRGHRMFGTVVPELRREAVASGYFFILRPKSDKVLPRYLAWFLNEPGFQRWLQPLIRGSHMPIISRSDFAELPVIVPDLQTQQRIVQLNDLMLTEAQLMDQLKEKRAELISGVSRKLLSTSSRKKA